MLKINNDMSKIDGKFKYKIDRFHLKKLLYEKNTPMKDLATFIGLRKPDSFYKKCEGMQRFNFDEIIEIMKYFNKSFEEIFHVEKTKRTDI